MWPIVYRWILDNVRARAVYIDEKWLKIRGKWLYWFVVLDTETGLPVLAALLPSTGKWACRWIVVKLKLIGNTSYELKPDINLCQPNGGNTLC